jgi:MoaF-like
LLDKQNWSIFGSVFEAIFADRTFQLVYKDEGKGNATLTLTEIRGPHAGNKLLLPVKIVELRPKLFMVTWQEPNKESVTEIEDYENGFLYANITSPKDRFFTLKAELKLVS